MSIWVDPKQEQISLPPPSYQAQAATKPGQQFVQQPVQGAITNPRETGQQPVIVNVILNDQQQAGAQAQKGPNRGVETGFCLGCLCAMCCCGCTVM